MAPQMARKMRKLHMVLLTPHADLLGLIPAKVAVLKILSDAPIFEKKARSLHE